MGNNSNPGTKLVPYLRFAYIKHGHRPFYEEIYGKEEFKKIVLINHGHDKILVDYLFDKKHKEGRNSEAKIELENLYKNIVNTMDDKYKETIQKIHQSKKKAKPVVFKYNELFGPEVYIEPYDIIISEKWFIEIFCLGNEYVKYKYSRYAMGVKDEYENINEYDLQDALYTMVDKKVYLPELSQSFNYHKGKFKSLFEIDMDSFDQYDFPEKQREEFKILFMLVKFLEEFNINFTNLIKIKSMENVAVSMYSNMLNKNGDIFHYLQLELQKEALTSYWHLPHSMLSIRRSITEIVHNFELFLYDIKFFSPNDIDNLYNFCNKYFYFNFNSEEYNIEHQYGLLHTFYLRLVEYELKCIKTDEQSIMNRMPEYYNRRKPIFKNNINIANLNAKTINNKEDFRKFFRENKEYIFPLITNGKVTERTYSTWIREFIDTRFDIFCKIYKDIFGVELSKPYSANMIIAILYETLSKNKDNIINPSREESDTYKKEDIIKYYQYYSYSQKGQNGSNELTTRLNLKCIDENEPDKSLLRKRAVDLIRRIQCTYYILEGDNEVFLKYTKLLGFLDHNLTQILEYDDMYSMLYISNYLLTILDIYSYNINNIDRLPSFENVSEFCQIIEKGLKLKPTSLKLKFNTISHYLLKNFNANELAGKVLVSIGIKYLSAGLTISEFSEEINKPKSITGKLIITTNSKYLDMINTLAIGFTIDLEFMTFTFNNLRLSASFDEQRAINSVIYKNFKEIDFDYEEEQ